MLWGFTTKTKKRPPRSENLDELQWLENRPTLQELIDRHPQEWETVGEELVEVLGAGRIDRLNELALRAKNEESLWLGRVRRDPLNREILASALPPLRQSRMRLLALDQCSLAAATGKSSGRIRFNLFNGLLVQKLLFRQGLERKPASLTWFRVCWPLITQKRLLMPLVQAQGIYCFYTGKLIREMAGLIAGRPSLEIAAGDGTLSRFLARAGVAIRATDDGSWSHVIPYPQDVERLDAGSALKRYRPRAVVCSWPPPGNGFEQRVFSTPSVELYLVIGSRHPFASGNWAAYQNQDTFSLEISPRMSRTVLPPELDSAVLIFRRKTA